MIEDKLITANVEMLKAQEKMRQLEEDITTYTYKKINDKLDKKLENIRNKYLQ